MPNKTIVEVNLSALPRPLAAAVRYLAELSWVEQRGIQDIGVVQRSLLPTTDAARMLGIPRSTINYWARMGKIKAWQDAPGKQWRVDVEDVREYLIRNQG